MKFITSHKDFNIYLKPECKEQEEEMIARNGSEELSLGYNVEDGLEININDMVNFIDEYVMTGEIQ